jgi:hypothetical protein
MRTRAIVVLASAALWPALLGCAAQEAKWTQEAAQYSVYAAKQIPLYPGAKVEDVMGSDSYGDSPEEHSEGMAWWFVVEHPKDKVVAWYDARLQKAKRTTDEDGDIIYTMIPEGGEAGEEMGVIVEEGKVRVFESTKAGKHKDT